MKFVTLTLASITLLMIRDASFQNHLEEGKEKPLLRGHPWVFSGAVENVKEMFLLGISERSIPWKASS